MNDTRDAQPPPGADPSDPPEVPSAGTESFDLREPDAPAQVERSSWFGPLFLVPLGLVGAAVALYLFMSWMVRDKSGPEDYLRQLTSGAANASKQGYYSLVTALQSYQAGDRLEELPPGFEAQLAAAFDATEPEDAMVRVATAQSLVLLDSELAFERVVRLVEESLDSGGVVEPTNPLESLGIVEKQHLNTLTRGIELLGAIGDPRAIPLLEETLQSSDPGVRQISAAALGGIRDERTLAPLRAALEDPEREVRWNAAVALAKQGDGAGLDELESMLSLDSYQGYRNEDYRDRAILFALKALEVLRADSARPTVESLVAQLEERYEAGEGGLQVAAAARRWLELQASGWPEA